MNSYTYNRGCSCLRCRIKGLMGPAILITLGVLFLLNEFYVIDFNQSFPVLLIVIGLMLYLGRSGSIEGHIEPQQPPLMPPPPTPGAQGPEVNR